MDFLLHLYWFDRLALAHNLACQCRAVDIKTLQVKPDWSYGIYVGGSVAAPKPMTAEEKHFEVKKLERKIRKPNQESVDGFGLFDTQKEMFW